MLPVPTDVTRYVWQPQPVATRRRQTDLRRRVTFLRELQRTGSVLYAAGRAGVDRRTVYRWRDADERFRQRWNEALERRRDHLLDRGYLLATTGSARYFTRNGQPVGTYRRYDERLIMFMIGQMRARPSAVAHVGEWDE